MTPEAMRDWLNGLAADNLKRTRPAPEGVMNYLKAIRDAADAQEEFRRFLRDWR